MRYAKVLAHVVSIILVMATVLVVIPIRSESVRGDSITTTEATEPTQEPLINAPILFSEVGYKVPVSYKSAIDLQTTLKGHVAELEVEVASNTYTDEAISMMNDEIGRLEIDIERLQLDINTFNKWQEEYPVAAEVWFYLRNQGYSEEVSAGIIGNMMIETAGGTLGLKPIIYSPGGSFYGLCQWSMYYYPSVKDLDTQGQLDFLMGNIEKEFNTFGFCYAKGFTYNDFLNIESPEAAAKAFAKVYERCAAGSYGMRQECARVAYNYFTTIEVTSQ